MDRPIAFFDSGVGGLTVLKSAMRILPQEKYIYLADNAFFPYGVKSFDQLEQRVQQVTKYLVSLDVKAIVVACNTASVHLKSIGKYAKMPIIDVIAPTCNYVAKVSKNKRACLLATNATVQSQMYQEILKTKGVDLVAVPCSELVPLAEGGELGTSNTKRIISNKLLAFSKLTFDTVIFGCTHFGLLKEQISSVLGKRRYVQCGMPTALELRKQLQQNNLLCSNHGGGVKLLTTGKIDAIDGISRLFDLDFSNAKVVHI